MLDRKHVVKRTDCGKSNTSAALAIEVLLLHCCTMMRVVATPESAVPSLTESSPASTDTDDVTRVLFDIDTPEQKSRTSSPRVHWPNQDGTYRDSSYSSDVSVASLSLGDASYIVKGEYAGDSQSLTPHSPQQLVSGSKSDLQRSKVGDDMVIETSCHGGLNLSPIDVAKIFDIFDGSQKQWPLHQAYSEVEFQPPSSTSETSTTVTSNMGLSSGKSTQREKSLEHECVALKEILRVDSENILKLKSEQEKLRAVDSEHKTAIRLLKLELDAAKREKELQQERESQHVETIKILKEEVDSLTRVGSVWSRKKIEQMRLENELFASQIIENEVETKEIRSSLELLLVENEEIRSDLASVRGEQGVQYKTTSDQVEEVGTLFPKTDLAKQVESLELRLQNMERAKEWTMQSLGEERRHREEPESPRDMIRSEAPVKLFSDRGVPTEEDKFLDAGSEAQEVEVTLEGPVEKQTSLSQQGKDPESPKKAIQDDDGWNGLCDCFPSTSQNEV
jgi:hypothetical protein